MHQKRVSVQILDKIILPLGVRVILDRQSAPGPLRVSDALSALMMSQMVKFGANSYSLSFRFTSNPKEAIPAGTGGRLNLLSKWLFFLL